MQNYYLTLLVTLDLESTTGKPLDGRFETSTRCIAELCSSLFHDECKEV